MLSLQQVLCGVIEGVWRQTDSHSGPGLAFGQRRNLSPCNMREGRDGAGVSRSVDAGKRMKGLPLMASTSSHQM